MSNILITGATGHFGKATIDFLLRKGVQPGDISALVRNESKATALKDTGVNLVKGNYKDYDSLLKAFAGIDKLLFVSSSEMDGRSAQHENVVKAAREAGVKFVLYTSYERKTETAASPIAFVGAGHLAAEKSLEENGLNHTIFRNNIYMDFIPFFIGDKVLESKAISLPAGKSKGGFALRAEMAEAAANVLTSSGHEGKKYHISNTEGYSYEEVAQVISEITGTKINYVSPPIEGFIEKLIDAGLPAEFAQATTAFAQAHAQGEFEKASGDLEDLLGRKPTTLKVYLETVFSKN